MKTLLKLEELAELVLGVYLFSQLYWAWGYFLGLYFSPDLGMLGYLINPKIGAWSYNLLHHKAVAIACLLAGWYWQAETISLLGTVLLAHAAFDRLMGYGLKHESAFHATHLGVVGKQKNVAPAGIEPASNV